MPKRKRDNDDALEGTAGDSANTRRINYKLKQSGLKLAHAFKLARSFERLKLQRREREAKAARLENNVERIGKESAALQTLDNTAFASILLYKTLAKIKSVSNSELFADFLASPPEPLKQEGALNVYGRLCGATVVKEALQPILEEILQAAHLEAFKAPPRMPKTREEFERARKGQEQMHESRRALLNAPKAICQVVKPRVGREAEQKAVETDKDDDLMSESDEEGDSGEAGKDFDSDDDFDDFQNRLASSDEGSDDDDMDVATLERQLRGEGIKGNIGTVEDSDSEDLDLAALEQQLRSEGVREDFSGSESEIPIVEKPRVKPKKKAAPSKPISSSILLPSLTMGGYLSASDGSEAEDIDEKPRKNRPGQRARQAIWEKKYGAKAKHLKDGSKNRDQGWDMKRGAVGDSRRDDRRGPRLDSHSVVPVRKPAKKDDAGPLHPSWVAAKKAKEQKAAASFAGTKISFD